jgi:hypothetical protein
MSKSPSRGRGRKTKPVTFETVRQIALALPGVVEGTSYGTPAFRVKGKFLARLREDGESLAVKIGFDEREILMKIDPETFFITDHYLGYPTILVRLSRVHPDDLRMVLEQAWKRVAPKRLVNALKSNE